MHYTLQRIYCDKVERGFFKYIKTSTVDDQPLFYLVIVPPISIKSCTARVYLAICEWNTRRITTKAEYFPFIFTEQFIKNCINRRTRIDLLYSPRQYQRNSNFSLEPLNRMLLFVPAEPYALGNKLISSACMCVHYTYLSISEDTNSKKKILFVTHCWSQISSFINVLIRAVRFVYVQRLIRITLGLPTAEGTPLRGFTPKSWPRIE